MKQESLEGSMSLPLIVVEASRCMKGYCLQAKSKIKGHIRTYVLKIQTLFAKKVKFVRHDVAREFATSSIKPFYNEEGIEQQQHSIRSPD